MIFLTQMFLVFFCCWFCQLELSVSQDFSIHIGDHVMVKCPAAKDQQQYFRDVEPRKDCVVAINVTDATALLQKNITGPVVATGNQVVSPNQRTVFCVERYVHT